MNIFLQIIAFSSLAFIIGLMVGAAMASAKNEDLQTEVEFLRDKRGDLEREVRDEKAARKAAQYYGQTIEREAKKLERKVNEYELKQRPDRRFS